MVVGEEKKKAKFCAVRRRPGEGGPGILSSPLPTSIFAITTIIVEKIPIKMTVKIVITMKLIIVIIIMATIIILIIITMKTIGLSGTGLCGIVVLLSVCWVLGIGVGVVILDPPVPPLGLFPRRRTALRRTAQHFALFFPLQPFSILLSLSGCLLVEFWWCF